jgi:transcription initiation factor IIE alpha subunit
MTELEKDGVKIRIIDSLRNNNIGIKLYPNDGIYFMTAERVFSLIELLQKAIQATNIERYKIKPCKCGGETWLTGGYSKYLFECEKCAEYLVSFDTLEAAIAAWNKRMEP